MTQFIPTQLENELSLEISQHAAHLSPDNKLAYETLLGMHTYKRPHGSRTERRFINRFLIPLGLRVDTYNNYFKCIGKDPAIMWSCHIDTVHDKKGMQRLGFAEDGKELGVAKGDGSDCLGADDGAGVWVMQQMILAERPGVYVFHRDEEHGRKGSLHIAKNFNKLPVFKGVKFCIALDRRGEGSIITHQMGYRCCSETFSKSLAAQLKLGGLDFKSDDGGSFTDSASYTDLIGECTNLSVGYTDAHSAWERLNLDYIFRVRDACMQIDADKLEELRKPGDKEVKTYSYTNTGNYGSYYNSTDTMMSPIVYKDFKGNWYFWHDGVKYWCTKDTTPAWQDRLDESTEDAEPGYKSPDLVVPSHNGTGRSVALLKGTKSGTQVGTTSHWADDLETPYSSPGADDAAIINTGKMNGHDVINVDKDDLPPTENDFLAMTKLVKENPDIVADILEQMGYNVTDLRTEILECCGVT